MVTSNILSMAPEDTNLVIQAQNGDMSAFEQLVFRHDKQVLTIVARYVTNAEDAKDIYQEVFFNVYRGIKNFKFKSEFTTWLYRITTNVCLTHRSQSKKRFHIPLESDSDGDADEPHGNVHARSAEHPPDVHAINSEIAMRVENALSILSSKQRLVFTLKYYQSYKLREIATMMDCKEGTVKRYLFTATRRMRKQLEDLL
jgi:RNA polymerase sigma-70 factor (ECF subfamily)